MPLSPEGKLARGLLFVGIVGVIVVLAAIGGAVFGGPNTYDRDDDGDGATTPRHPEYQPDALLGDRLDDEGGVAVSQGVVADGSGEGKTVLIDAAHANRYQQEDIQALVRAIVDAGHEVQFAESSADFSDSLSSADAFVVIDPGLEYSAEEVDAVESFADRGGRVVVLAEPNRKEISSSAFSVSVSTVRSRVTALTARFGVTVRTEYVYDMEANDDNFKNVVVTPADTRAAPADVQQVALYTAAAVEARDGRTVLHTSKSAQVADGPQGVRSVAVRDGNVIVVGDTDFMAPIGDSVADNEDFIGFLVEFLLTGDTEPETSEPEPTPTPTPEPTQSGGGDGNDTDSS